MRSVKAIKKILCAVCGNLMDLLYPCHCETHGCTMPDGLCDECIEDDVSENGPV